MSAPASPPFVPVPARAPSPALSGEALSVLRRRVAAIGTDGQRRALAEETPRLTLGHPAADGALGGGLMTAAPHEMRPAAPGDMAAATGFALAVAARLCRRDGASRTWLWIRQDLAGRETGEPYGPGLAAFGADPARLVLVAAADAREALRAAEEGLRCAPLGCVLLEPWGGAKALDLTAMRRLALAAEASGVTLLMLRSGTHDAAAADGPGGAMTRWSIAAAPSVPGPATGALPGLGRPAFAATLLRNRQTGRLGDGGRWILEWNPDEHRFAPSATLPGARSLAPLHGPPAAPGEAAADRDGPGGSGGLRRAG
jgi:protein ImuA